MSDDSSKPAEPTKQDLEWAWKWFEIHVGHRTNVLNFLMVAFGALAVAYAELIHTDRGAAGVLAGTAAAMAAAFMRLDFVTMAKIKHAKEILADGGGRGAKLFSAATLRFGDRVVTRLFEGLLIALSAAGAIVAYIGE